MPGLMSEFSLIDGKNMALAIAHRRCFACSDKKFVLAWNKRPNHPRMACFVRTVWSEAKGHAYTTLAIIWDVPGIEAQSRVPMDGKLEQR